MVDRKPGDISNGHIPGDDRLRRTVEPEPVAEFAGIVAPSLPAPALRPPFGDDPEFRRILDCGVLLLAGLASFFLIAQIPARATTSGFRSEFVHHSHLLTSLESDGSALYSLWYVFQIVLVGDDRHASVLFNAGWLLIGAFAFIKGVVFTGALMIAAYSRIQALIVGFLLGCAIAMPIPILERKSSIVEGPVYYLGTLPPNVFASATQLVANPAAVVAVVLLSLWYVRPTSGRFAAMAIAGLIATAAKPGIGPALIGTTVILTGLIIHKKRQAWRPAVARMAVSSALIGLPVIFTYLSFMTDQGQLARHTELRPMATWTAFTNQWFVDLIASLTFPLAVLIVILVCGRAVKETRALLLPAWLTMGVATAMFALLAEVDRTGQVQYSGNFAWGAIAANAGLYAVSAIALWRVSWRARWIPLAVLSIQAASGIVYLNRYLDTGPVLLKRLAAGNQSRVPDPWVVGLSTRT